MLAKPTQILSVAVPVVTAIVLGCICGTSIPMYTYLLMIFGIPLFIFLTSTILGYFVNRSTEYLGAYVTTLTYYEPWNEKVLRTRQVPDGKDENGYIRYKTETYYETVYHPDSYTYDTNIGKHGNITRETFEVWKGILGDNDPTFVNMYRNYDTIDGNAWEYKWNNDITCMVPMTYKHRYYNPFKYSSSIFANRIIDEKTAKEYGLFEHPGIHRYVSQHCVIGTGDYSTWDLQVQRLNGLLGWLYQFRLFIIVFDGTTTSMDNVFQLQKAYWNGGNKNEFVLCVGIDPRTNKLIWHNSFSWSKEPRLEAETRNYLSSKGTFSCYELCGWMEEMVPKYWKRRNFSEFKYINTYLPQWANILLFIVSVITTVGIGTWCH